MRVFVGTGRSPDNISNENRSDRAFPAMRLTVARSVCCLITVFGSEKLV